MAIIVDFSTGVDKKTAEPLWQWDYGQVLKITGLGTLQVAQVHFCDRSCTETIVRLGNLINDGLEVTIPDKLLENEWDINAFVYVCGEGCGQTIKHVQIPVIKRKKPEDYIDPIPPTAQTELEQMIAAVNETLANIEDLYNDTITVEDLNEMITEEVTKQVESLKSDVADIQNDIQSLTTRVSNLEFNVNTYILKYPSSITAKSTEYTLVWNQDDPSQEKALVRITPSPAESTNYTLGVQAISGASKIMAEVKSNTSVLFELTSAAEKDKVYTYKIYVVERPSVYVNISITVG